MKTFKIYYLLFFLLPFSVVAQQTSMLNVFATPKEKNQRERLDVDVDEYREELAHFQHLQRERQRLKLETENLELKMKFKELEKKEQEQNKKIDSYAEAKENEIKRLEYENRLILIKLEYNRLQGQLKAMDTQKVASGSTKTSENTESVNIIQQNVNQKNEFSFWVVSIVGQTGKSYMAKVYDRAYGLRLVNVGAPLSDGYSIAKIERDRVFIKREKDSEKYTIMPFRNY